MTQRMRLELFQNEVSQLAIRSKFSIPEYLIAASRQDRLKEIHNCMDFTELSSF